MICRAVMPSDTLARKAQRLLTAHEFSAEVIRNTSAKDGCGFGLRIVGDCTKAQKLLEREGIPVRSIRIERGLL